MFQKLNRFQTFHILRGNHHDKARWTLWGVHLIFKFKQLPDNYTGLPAGRDEACSPISRRVGRLRLQRRCVCGPTANGLCGANDTATLRDGNSVGIHSNPLAPTMKMVHRD
jgi:hypothetical protein